MIFTDVVNQGLYFCAGLFCGILCGIIYDTLFGIRITIKAGKITVFIFDLLFFIFSIIIVFFFMYKVNFFDIKWYILAGMIVGFCIERYFFEKPIAQTIIKVYNILKRLKKFLTGLNFFKKKKDKGENDDRKAITF